jgi:hypothetical protein
MASKELMARLLPETAAGFQATVGVRQSDFDAELSRYITTQPPYVT